MKASRKLAVMAAAVVTAASGATALLGSPAANAATSGGTATLVNPSNAAPLSFGGSHTAFTFKLPAGASCSGDSANNGFFVFTFITPAANNPLNLTFSSSTGPNNPAGSFAFPLFDQAGSPLISTNTAPNTGQVKDFPATIMDFSKFMASGSPDGLNLPGGAYNIGVACKGNGVTDKVWSSTVSFTTTACDGNGEVWAVPPATNPTAQPHAPTVARNLTAAPGGLLSFAVQLSWAPPTDNGCGAVHYVIMRGTAAGAESALTTVSGTSFTDSGHTLDILTTFYYKVVAVNAFGSSAASNEAHSKAEPWNLIPL